MPSRFLSLAHYPNILSPIGVKAFAVPLLNDRMWIPGRANAIKHSRADACQGIVRPAPAKSAYYTALSTSYSHVCSLTNTIIQIKHVSGGGCFPVPYIITPDIPAPIFISSAAS